MKGQDNSIDSVARLAAASKFRRMLNHPFKYVFSMVHKMVIYPITHKEISVKTHMFNGQQMLVALPASMDIYLTGGKTHSSEIRLAKFLLKHLKSNSTMMDIGAHYGYFSMLTADVAKKGQVYAFEPASKSYGILERNLKGLPNVRYFNKAVSDKDAPVTFYEFDNLHSEYNSTQVSQYQEEKWFQSIAPKVQEVEAITLNEFAQNISSGLDFIKIDVEGFEREVIQGGEAYLRQSTSKPVIIMEYLEPKRGNASHREAKNLLIDWGYESYVIKDDGSLERIDDVDAYLVEQNLESDNIVFVYGQSTHN